MASPNTLRTGDAVSNQTDAIENSVAIKSDYGEISNSYNPAWIWLFSAWVVALAASLGALFIGEVLGQEPCNLCWYQRIAMFPLAFILGLACLYNDLSVRRYAFLPLPIVSLASFIVIALLLTRTGIHTTENITNE